MCGLCALAPLFAQVTVADYQRALSLRERYDKLTANVAEEPHWIGDSNRFWYRKSVLGGHRFFVVDAVHKTKQEAFDHAKLAASLNKAENKQYTADTLPFREIHFSDDGKTVEYGADDSEWKTKLADYSTVRVRALERRGNGVGEKPRPPLTEMFNKPVESPDHKWEALIRNFNVWIRAKGSTSAEPLSFDGSEGNYYDLETLTWSPDSKKLVAYRDPPRAAPHD